MEAGGVPPAELGAWAGAARLGGGGAGRRLPRPPLAEPMGSGIPQSFWLIRMPRWWHTSGPGRAGPRSGRKSNPRGFRA